LRVGEQGAEEHTWDGNNRRVEKIP